MFDVKLVDIAALPSVAFDARRELPDCQGIYFATTVDAVLYIGRAMNINQRWIGHHRKADVARWEGVKLSWLVFDGPPALLDEIERACIEHFNPILNGGSVEYSPTVRVQLVIPADVLDEAKELASIENRSISNMLATLVTEAIKARKEAKSGQWEPALLAA